MPEDQRKGKQRGVVWRSGGRDSTPAYAVSDMKSTPPTGEENVYASEAAESGVASKNASLVFKEGSMDMDVDQVCLYVLETSPIPVPLNPLTLNLNYRAIKSS